MESMLESKMADRRKAFKLGVDGDEARRQREDETVQLRKNKRGEVLAKKRMIDTSAAAGATADQENRGDGANGTVLGNEAEPTLKELPQCAAAILGSVRDPAFKAARDVRKLLSVADDPPIKEVVQLGLLPRLVQFLGDDTDPELQFEAAWALTNIASGDTEDTLLVASLGTIPLFSKLLESPSDNVKEQAVWALANMAGENATLRDQVVDAALFRIMALIEQVGRDIYVEKKDKYNILRNATWAFSNSFRGEPAVATERVKPGLALLAGLMQVEDKDVAVDAAWGASYFTHKADTARLQVALDAGFHTAVVKVLGADSGKQIQPALRTAGNLVAGDDCIAEALIGVGLLQRIPKLLRQSNKAICKETVWMVSNIVGGTEVQVAAVIQAGIVHEVLGLSTHSKHEDVKRECVHVIANICRAGSQFIQALIELGTIQPLCQLLELEDQESVFTALLSLELMLNWGETVGQGENPVATAMEKAGVIPTLEQLQDDGIDKVYQKALDLLEDYFGGEEVADDGRDGGTEDSTAFNFA